MKKIIGKAFAVCAAAALMSVCPVSAEAAKLRTENGLKYIQSDDGQSSLYTGWTNSDGIRRYYSNGKRCVGRKNINGREYYLLRNGGYVQGYYVVNGKLYEAFNGKICGPFSISDIDGDNSDGNTSAFQSLSTLTFTVHPNGQKWLSDYAGYHWDSEKGQYIIDLTDLKRQDFYKGLACGCQEFGVRLVKYSYNELMEVDRAVFTADNFRNFCLNSCDISAEENCYVITVFEDDKVETVADYLLSEGFEEDIFRVEYNPEREIEDE